MQDQDNRGTPFSSSRHRDQKPDMSLWPRQQPIAAPQRSSSVQDDGDEIDLLGLAAQLWRGKWVIAICALLAGFLGAANAVLTPPTYRANALLQLEERSGQLALPDAMSSLFDNSPTTNAEIEIVRSRLVLSRASAEINLDWQMVPRLAPVIGDAMRRYNLPVPDFEFMTPFTRKGETARLDLLEVPPGWVGEEILLTAEAGGMYRLDFPDGTSQQGQVGTTLRDTSRGFAVRIGVLEASPGREYSVKQRTQRAALQQLRSSLSVSELGRGSNILNLTLTAEAPDQAERRLNAIAQAYLAQNVSRSAAEAASSLTFVESQIPDAERAVSDAEAALNAFRTQQESVDLELETQSLLTQIATLDAELRALDAEEEELQQLYTTNHPAYRQLLNNRERLEARMAELRSETGELPQTQREIINLTQELELAQAIYVELLNRAQELRVLMASSIGNVRILDSAEASPFAISPRRSRIVALALILGLMAGAGIVLLRNFLRKGVQAPDDIEKLGLPVFATINLVEEKYQATSRTETAKLVALEDSANLAVEGLRSLRTGLHYGMLDARTKTLAITSAAPGAGKSFTSANLAVVSAQADQKVCLIDADMRRGSLRRYMNTRKGQPGLAELLAGDAKLEDVLVKGPTPGLSFLPTGRFPPNPSELLMRGTLARLLAELDTKFDLTIIDCPPALAVTDPVVIGRAAGTTIAVIRHTITPVGEIQALQKTLETGGVSLSGAVLNGFDPRKGKAGYGYGYGYGYRYAYGAKTEQD